MIGDLVYICDAVEKVSVLHPKHGFPIGFENEGTEYIDEDLVTPIPLTREILEKNHYEKSPMFKDETGKYVEYSTWFPVSKDEEVFVRVDFLENNIVIQIEHDHRHGMDRVHFSTIRYVHEFQHVLRMIGLQSAANNLNI